MTLTERLDIIQHKYEFNDSQLVSKLGISLDDLRNFRSGDNSPSRRVDAYKLSLITSFIDKLEADIYPTRLLESMHGLLNATMRDTAITVIGSISGAGKTFAAEMFCHENANAVYIYVPEIISPRYLLSIISLKLGLPHYGFNLQQMYEQICGELSKEKKLFVFDEADRLNKKMFEILRDIWHDGKGNCSIALVGDENLMNKIKRGQSLRENLIRLIRRVKYSEIFDPFYEEDITIIFKNCIGRHKISDVLRSKLFEEIKSKGGGLGTIIDLAKLIKKLAEKTDGSADNDTAREAWNRIKKKF